MLRKWSILFWEISSTRSIKIICIYNEILNNLGGVTLILDSCQTFWDPPIWFFNYLKVVIPRMAIFHTQIKIQIPNLQNFTNDLQLQLSYKNGFLPICSLFLTYCFLCCSKDKGPSKNSSQVRGNNSPSSTYASCEEPWQHCSNQSSYADKRSNPWLIIKAQLIPQTGPENIL